MQEAATGKITNVVGVESVCLKTGFMRVVRHGPQKKFIGVQRKAKGDVDKAQGENSVDGDFHIWNYRAPL